MQLKLKQLRHAVVRVLEDHKTGELLRTEAKRVLGTSAVLDADVSAVAEHVLNVVESKQLTNVHLDNEFKLSALLKFAEHSDASVRKLAAKLLPKKNVRKLLEDVDECVRFAAASRLTSSEVKNLIERTGDDSYVDLYENKVISEAKEERETRLTGDVVKTQEGPELSKHFYDSLAARFLQDYGTSLFTNWKLAAKRYVSSVKATSLVDIDLDKLTKAIEDAVRARDEEMYEPIKETVKRLKCQLDALDEQHDPVADLLKEKHSASGYIDRFESLFEVTSVNFRSHRALKEHLISEIDRVPTNARTPSGRSITSVDEKALDRYVLAWNKRHNMSNNMPTRLQWSIDVSDTSVAKFTVKE